MPSNVVIRWRPKRRCAGTFSRCRSVCCCRPPEPWAGPLPMPTEAAPGLAVAPQRHPLLEVEGLSLRLQDNRANRSEERRVGKDVSVRVDLGGRRIIKKKKITKKNQK